METDLQVWQLILNASWMVKFVMLVPLLASVASWMIIFRKRAALNAAEKGASRFEERFWSGTGLNQLHEQATGIREALKEKYAAWDELMLGEEDAT